MKLRPRTRVYADMCSVMLSLCTYVAFQRVLQGGATGAVGKGKACEAGAIRTLRIKGPAKQVCAGNPANRVCTESREVEWREGSSTERTDEDAVGGGISKKADTVPADGVRKNENSPINAC